MNDYELSFGGGGGRTGEDNVVNNGQESRTTGVVAKSKEEKDAVKKSVEKEYQEYIDFDDEGNVIIKKGGKDAAESNKNSNFYRLYKLATNDKYLFQVNLVNRNAKVITQFNGTGSTQPYSLSIQDEQDLGWPYVTVTYGFFLPPINTPLQFASYDGIGHAFVDINVTSTNNYVAHELYFHAYNFLINIEYSHPPMDVPRKCRYYKNANR